MTPLVNLPRILQVLPDKGNLLRREDSIPADTNHHGVVIRQLDSDCLCFFRRATVDMHKRGSRAVASSKVINLFAD